MGAPADRPCEHTRCRRRVFDAQVIPARGAPVDLVIDATPQTWEQGARIVLVGHLTYTGVERVMKLTQSTIHKAFAAALYVEHREMCEADQRKTKAKKTQGHA